MDLKQTVMVVSKDERLLKKLRRKGPGCEPRIKKDAAGKEYLEALFDAVPYKFYLGVPRTFPYNVGHSLRRSNLVPIDEECLYCKGTGHSKDGICHQCKGKKFINTEEIVPIFDIVRDYDPMIVDPESVTSQPSVLAEAAASAT